MTRSTWIKLLAVCFILLTGCSAKQEDKPYTVTNISASMVFSDPDKVGGNFAGEEHASIWVRESSKYMLNILITDTKAIASYVLRNDSTNIQVLEDEEAAFHTGTLVTADTAENMLKGLYGTVVYDIAKDCVENQEPYSFYAYKELELLNTWTTKEFNGVELPWPTDKQQDGTSWWDSDFTVTVYTDTVDIDMSEYIDTIINSTEDIDTLDWYAYGTDDFVGSANYGCDYWDVLAYKHLDGITVVIHARYQPETQNTINLAEKYGMKQEVEQLFENRLEV